MSDIGEASRLVLTSDDEDFLILGTSTGFIFVIRVKDFRLMYNRKVSHQKIMDIQNTKEGTVYKILLKIKHICIA